MRETEFERREGLARMIYAAEVFLRTLNMWHGKWYQLRSVGPVLRDEQQITHGELRAALDYLQERRYIDARRTKDRVIVQIADYALEDLECKFLPDGTALLAGQGQDPLIDP